MSTNVSSGPSTWAVDAVHSSVAFSARHMMIAKVRGTFSRLEGRLQIPGGTVIPEYMAAEIDAGSVNTLEKQRDDHLRSYDFLDVEKFPLLTFSSTSVQKIGDTAFNVTGDLTIRGIKKNVTFLVQVEGQGIDPWGNRRIGYTAKLRIDRRDFGLTFNQALETGGVLVGNDVDIELDIEVVPSAA